MNNISAMTDCSVICKGAGRITDPPSPNTYHRTKFGLPGLDHNLLLIKATDEILVCL